VRERCRGQPDYRVVAGRPAPTLSLKACSPTCSAGCGSVKVHRRRAQQAGGRAILPTSRSARQPECREQVCGTDLGAAAWVLLEDGNKIIGASALHERCLKLTLRWRPHFSRTATPRQVLTGQLGETDTQVV
jgi:hypothetical protein